MNLVSTMVYMFVLVAILLLQNKQEFISWVKQKYSSKFVFLLTPPQIAVFMMSSSSVIMLPAIFKKVYFLAENLM